MRKKEGSSKLRANEESSFEKPDAKRTLTSNKPAEKKEPFSEEQGSALKKSKTRDFSEHSSDTEQTLFHCLLFLVGDRENYNVLNCMLHLESNSLLVEIRLTHIYTNRRQEDFR